MCGCVGACEYMYVPALSSPLFDITFHTLGTNGRGVSSILIARSGDNVVGWIGGMSKTDWWNRTCLFVNVAV